MKKHILMAVSSILSILLLASCASPVTAVLPSQATPPASTKPSAPAGNHAKEPFFITTVSAPEYTISEEDIFSHTSNWEAVSAKSASFGLDLAARLEEDTFIFSPFSVYLALSALMEGTSGKTAEELAKALCPSDMDPGDFHQGVKSLLQLIQEEKKGNALDINTLLALSSDYTVNQDFSNTLRDYFNGTTASMDFSNPKATEELNKWAKEKTNGMIDPLHQEPLPAATAMALLNSVYFLGQWQEVFEEADNFKGDFHGKNKTTQQTFMTRNGEYSYIETDVYQSVILPYTSGASMSLFLPKEGKTTADVLDSLKKGRPDYENGEGQVTIPKFETESEIPLDNLLKSAGLSSMYEGSLTNIANEQELYVDTVFQKAKIKVNETGTEAAAVTEIVARATGILLDPVPFQFTADRPFVYTIDYSDTNLFVGVQSDF